MHAARKIIVTNAAFAAVVVLAFIGYAKLSGLGIDEQCMGFRRDWRLGRSPAWSAPLMIEGAVLILLSLRNLVGERRARFFIGGFSAITLVFSLVLPLLTEQVYGTKFFAFDVALWWYACFSNIAYGLVGSSESGA